MPRKYYMTANIEYTQTPDGLWNATARYRSRSISVFEHGEKKDARKQIKSMAEKLQWLLKEDEA